MYELFIEGLKVDIDQKISIQLTFALDDIANYGSRETSFSKTIVLPGTGRNNQIFGYIYDISSFNYELPGGANIGSVFNAAQTSRAELRLNGLLVLKGVFRIVNIIKDKDIIEYEGALFGELAGFIADIGAKKLDELDFSAYNHNYTRDNIVNSWNTVNGSGYYYPLIDHGTYSTPELFKERVKSDYDYRTFRPALYVKEYIDKIFSIQNSNYKYKSDFFESTFFKSLIIPCNLATLKVLTNDLLVGYQPFTNLPPFQGSSFDVLNRMNLGFPNVVRNRLFLEYVGGDTNFPTFKYTNDESVIVNIVFNFSASILYSNVVEHIFRYGILKNDSFIAFKEIKKPRRANLSDPVINQRYFISDNIEVQVQLNKNDYLTFPLFYNLLITNGGSYIQTAYVNVTSANPVRIDSQINDPVVINNLIPQNITQKDFFTWILKMFNLYVVEDKLDEKLLHIIPYKDYLTNDIIDWTDKIARDKPWQIKPMGVLNSRFFEYKYKDDNDFYNESHKKKYNLSYGANLQDTKFEFAKDKQTIEVGFSPTVLIQYQGRDKVVPAIYKKSSGNSIDQEELMDSNIRILLAKKVTNITSWSIVNTGPNRNQSPTQLGASLTAYGYAGHFDDPVNPLVDINFGANTEIYFDPASYPSANLFNTYWSGYIAEIVDKDSKLLSCHARLNPLDIAQLDFSKPVMIDGVLFRLNKVEDYDYKNDELVKIELLKIVNYNPPCAVDWTKQNYTGTRFNNGDEIPQVTGTTAWANLTTPAWCYYNNDPANEATYGKLYNWYAINDPRGFAPLGYRVPSNSDWSNLVTCLGGTSVAGGKMKSTSLWTSPNTGATNESGFSALPGGIRFGDGTFANLNTQAYFWSSTESNINNAFGRSLVNNSDDIFNPGSVDKKSGFSVRLIKE